MKEIFCVPRYPFLCAIIFSVAGVMVKTVSGLGEHVTIQVQNSLVHVTNLCTCRQSLNCLCFIPLQCNLLHAYLFIYLFILPSPKGPFHQQC